jgi:hypothetical protein
MSVNNSSKPYTLNDVFTYRLFALLSKLKLTKRSIVFYGLYEKYYKPDGVF